MVYSSQGHDTCILSQWNAKSAKDYWRKGPFLHSGLEDFRLLPDAQQDHARHDLRPLSNIVTEKIVVRPAGLEFNANGVRLELPFLILLRKASFEKGKF
jgi:hypothetical protein